MDTLKTKRSNPSCQGGIRKRRRETIRSPKSISEK
jgi:hypothetical protein